MRVKSLEGGSHEVILFWGRVYRSISFGGHICRGIFGSSVAALLQLLVQVSVFGDTFVEVFFGGRHVENYADTGTIEYRDKPPYIVVRGHIY